MYKVIREFHDKYNLDIVYKVDSEFSSNEPERIKDLLDRGLIEGELQPSPNPIKEETTKVLEENKSVKKTTRKSTKKVGD